MIKQLIKEYREYLDNELEQDNITQDEYDNLCNAIDDFKDWLRYTKKG